MTDKDEHYKGKFLLKRCALGSVYAALIFVLEVPGQQRNEASVLRVSTSFNTGYFLSKEK